MTTIRATSVAQNVLLSAVITGSIAGTSAKDVAISLKMKPDSFNSRVSALRTALLAAKKPFALPYLAGSGSRSKIDINDAAENAAKLMEELQTAQAKAQAEADSADAEGDTDES